MGLKIKSIIVSFLIIITTTTTNAAWEGPTDVISGTWGAGDNQFGITYSDTHDIFPGFIDISDNGYIVVSDGVNGRFKLFDSSGQLLRNITPPLENPKEWVIEPKFIGSNIVLITKKTFFFSTTGEVVASIDTPAKVEFWSSCDDKLCIKKRSPEQWLLYSPTGALIRATTERPLELGKVTEKKTTTGYTYTVQYPDLVNSNNVKTYTINLPGPYERFVRDNTGSINAIVGKMIRKFDAEGREIGVMRTPANEIRTIRPAGGGFEAETEVIAEYGEPVIAPNGDVYTWKRTPTAYSIIKWTWR